MCVFVWGKVAIPFTSYLLGVATSSIGSLTNYVDRFLALIDPSLPIVDRLVNKTYKVTLIFHNPPFTPSPNLLLSTYFVNDPL